MMTNEEAPINNRRVLEVFIENPNKQLTYDDLKGLRELTSESRIREALRALEREKILIGRYSRGRPKAGEKSKESKSYKLNKDLASFEKVFNIYCRSNIGKLLKTDYTNNIIKEFGFINIYNILRKIMPDQKFNNKASQAVLTHPEFIKEIQRYPDSIRKVAEYFDFPIMAYNFDANRIISDSPFVGNLDAGRLIDSLKDFEPMDAISFYRAMIKDTYSKLLRELEGNFFSESFHKFVDLDIFLSPFTSYPINDPIKLLFTRPFERLYDDIYLNDKSNYERFIQRAHVFYSNFGEILSQGINYLRWEEVNRLDYYIRDLEKKKATTDLEYRDEDDDIIIDLLGKDLDSLVRVEKPLDSILRTSIFYWNITSSRIDSLCEILNYTENPKGSGKYHIFTDEKGIKAIDLKTGDNIFDPDDSKKIISEYFLMDVLLDEIKDPFTYLRPCNAFTNLGFKVETNTYEKLLADFRSRMQ